MIKNLTLSLIAIVAISTSAIAETYPAYGPDSYKAIHDSRNLEGSEDITRKGFRLGLGLGVANTYIDNYYLNNDNLSDTGFATTFEIGYAPTNQLSVNYLSNVNWGSSDYEVSGGGGLAFNYYINNTVDTPYIVAGVGAIHYNADDLDELGFAGILGVGYAKEKIEFEITGIFGQHNDESMRQFFFTVSYLFY